MRRSLDELDFLDFSRLAGTSLGKPVVGVPRSCNPKPVNVSMAENQPCGPTIPNESRGAAGNNRPRIVDLRPTKDLSPAVDVSRLK
ncbi:jg3484 [Pararge aegeria aegeria]|uniref:Jg3484 protein n=1 Tax=Pararge aegeria aegeria TaxID=348720 RepID=A0A8S4RA73_9NEOP|nr:jg3484 [Pararge aegeria aegeria]